MILSDTFDCGGTSCDPRLERSFPVESTKKNTPVLYVILAAVLAVGLWAFAPVFITLIGDKAGAMEVMLVASSSAIAASVVVALVLWKKTVRLFHVPNRGALLRGVGWALLSGVFLSFWYYGYYRALQNAPKVDVTVIAFTWPLISIIAIRLFSPSTAKGLTLPQWLLVLLSFVGAAVIAVSNLQAGGTEQANLDILWAVAAALGSGLYLPFAIKSLDSFNSLLDSPSASTFYSISVVNMSALVVALTMSVGIMGEALDFSRVDGSVLLIGAVLGLGTYLAAEVAWTWAIQAHKSLTISTLPYFTPAASVLLLFFLFGSPLKAVAIIGLILILVSNLVLHLWKPKQAPASSAEAITEELDKSTGNSV